MKVPGIVPAKNDDDDWLSLDSESATSESSSEVSEAPGNSIPLQSRPHQPSSPTAPSQNASGPIASTGGISPGRPSLFDEDLPELAPLIESAVKEQSSSSQTVAPRASADNAPPNAADASGASPTKSKVTKPSATKPGATVGADPVRGSTPPRTKPATSQQPLPSLEDLDDDFKLSPIESTPKPVFSDGDRFPEFANLPSLDDLNLPGNALDIGSPLDAIEEEFGFPCKVCGTRLYAARSRAGEMIRCPDCYSEFSIPSPPKKQPKVVETKKELSDVSFKPIDAKSAKQPGTSKSQTDQLLEKAKSEIEAEENELDSLTTSFDGLRWFTLIFWFCRDPLLVFVMVLFGIVCGIWIPFVSAIPSLLEGNDRIKPIVQAIVFLLPCIPIFGALFALGMAVLTTVANQYRRIQDWPFGRPGETAAEVFTILAAAAIAGVPGGMIGSGIASATGTPSVTALFGLISLWLLFPFLLLSMADNNSITEPFSKNVFDSIKAKPDTWGAMYLQTMFALGLLFVLIAWSLRDGLIGEIAFGLLMPFLLLFTFNQYGLLAGRISDVTGLGFSGDFSQDESDE